MPTNLTANTSKGEVDTNLQMLSRLVGQVRDQVTLMYQWRQPFDAAYMAGLGYTDEQVAELTSLLAIAQAWVDMIGAGGTMSENDGVLFERMLGQVHGLGGQAGIVTAPPPPEV
jgi:hypothetical protein